MREIKSAFQIVIVLLLAMSVLVGCGSGVQVHGNTGGSVDADGEDSGNDGSPSPTDDEQPVTLSSYKDGICDVIANCFDMADAEDCANAAEGDLSLLAAFGVDGTYVTFTEVDDAILSGDVEPIAPKLIDCEAAIADIECTDAAVLSAYDEDNANDYSGISEIVPVADCGDLI